jgi:hypothetical protein
MGPSELVALAEEKVLAVLAKNLIDLICGRIIFIILMVSNLSARIANNLLNLNQLIASKSTRAIQLLAVSKTKPSDDIRAAYEAG